MWVKEQWISKITSGTKLQGNRSADFNQWSLQSKVEVMLSKPDRDQLSVSHQATRHSGTMDFH